MEHLHTPRRVLSTLVILLCLLLLIPAVVLALPQVETPARQALSPKPQRINPATDYLHAMDQLEALGLSRQQGQLLWSRMGEQLLLPLDSGALDRHTLPYLTMENCHEELLARYLAYADANPALPVEAVVLQVNMGLDYPFYQQTQEVADPSDPLALVNKYNSLPTRYVPELVELSSELGTGQLTKETADAFAQMAAAARAAGLSLRSVSAYRSYATQVSLHRRYTAQSGKAVADTFSAQGGYSEHQTGLALDINEASTRAQFENTKEYAWLVANCAEYGFVLRYPKDKQAITGYLFEPWHYRYVGVDIARICMEQGLSYEEYVAKLPVLGRNSPPPLTYLDKPLELGSGALVLKGTTYLCANQVAQAMGWATGTMEEGDQLLLYSDWYRLILGPGLRYERNEDVGKLSTPAIAIEGELYLSLHDLCTVMGLRQRTQPLGLALEAQLDTSQYT